MSRLKIVATVWLIQHVGQSDIIVAYAHEADAREKVKTYNSLYSKKIEAVPLNVWG